MSDNLVRIISKRKMLERLQFSKNLQTAIRAHDLIHGKMEECDINGMFLDAVCRDKYPEALMRADDHNKAALLAKDFSTGKFMRIAPDANGYLTGEGYYLKISFVNGEIEVTPSAGYNADVLTYTTFFKMYQEFKPIGI